jgi:hypothetical protein
MSDYFGALIRSSGMAFGGRASARSHDEASVDEIDVERGPAAMPSRTGQTASGPAHAVAPRAAAHSDAPRTPAADTDGVRAGFSGTEHARGRAGADVDRQGARSVETTPALGQARVRAAVQWVADDPQHVRGVTQVVPPHGQGWPARAEETSATAATQALDEPDVAVPVQRGTKPTSPPADLVAREPVVAGALPVHPARPTAPAPRPVAPLAHDEIVEISIGAIHVRVDAPAAHTLARSPATRPADAPRGLPVPPPRSALARRALRRI